MNEDKIIAQSLVDPNIDPKQEPKNKKKASFVKYILNIVFVLIVTGLSVGLTVFFQRKEILSAMEDINWIWIFAALGLVVLAFLFRTLIFYCFARLYSRQYRLHQAMALDQIGIFYNGVTPGASGGQFMQAYTYKKQGLPISAGASIMVMASIVYQSVLILYGVLSLAIRWDILAAIKPIEVSISGISFNIHIIPLIIAGFIVNLAVIGILFLMSYWKGFHHFMSGPMITFLNYLHIVKDKEKASESLRIQVENFKIELRRLLSNIPFTLLVMVLYFLVLTCMFGVPCFVGKALGASYDVSFSLFFDTIFMSNFHQMVTGLIPVPGSAGVSEYFFFQLFESFYKTSNGVSITAAAQLIWRTITFTLPIFIGGFVAAFYKASPKEEVQRRDLNMHTFVNLQQETYEAREEEMFKATQTAFLTRQMILSSLKLRDKKEQEQLEKEKLKAQERQDLVNDKDTNLKTNNIDESDWKEMNIGEDEEDI